MMRIALIYNAMVTCYRYDTCREIDSAHCQPCEYYDGHRQGGVVCKQGDSDVVDLDWDANNRLIAHKVASQSEFMVRSDLRSMAIALNCVATNVDGGQEMTPEEGMTAARTLLHDLGYPLVDEEVGRYG